MRAITLLAPAKVNLYLGVGDLRPDDYHDVSTILQTLDYGDVVRILPADELVVTTSVDLGIPEDHNLAYRAALAFAEEFSVPPRAIIEIEKHVPAGAGLGGGSSDAAAVIVGLARIHGIDPGSERCVAVARTLGADCAFFLTGGAALMTERGDWLEETLPTISSAIVLVKPAEPVPTAAAYARFDRAPAPVQGPERLIAALRAGDTSAVGGLLENNMTAAAASLVPEILDILVWLGGAPGVLGAALAGSGSATFALCEDATSATRAAEAARVQGWWAVATTTRAAGVEITDEDAGSE